MSQQGILIVEVLSPKAISFIRGLSTPISFGYWRKQDTKQENAIQYLIHFFIDKAQPQNRTVESLSWVY